ncbi:hypothetical protein BX666DRAFT_1852071 [Dichotomocladium elegans]|nr:hypothetical protein BX666DRAFT_1852071 [Dichotomocladium elegans]
MANNNTPLKQLAVIAGKNGLSGLHIPKITDDAEDVAGRIRLQKDGANTNGRGLDNIREKLQAYEYLCKIGEAREWIQDCLNEELDPILQLEESLRNGIILARLARWFTDGVVRRIYTACISITTNTSHVIRLSRSLTDLF